MKSFNFSCPIALAATFTTGMVALHGQIVLSGSSYTQDFQQLATGLPTGWSMHTVAIADLGYDLSVPGQITPTLKSLGDSTGLTFKATPTQWSTATAASTFGNSASPRNFYTTPGFTSANVVPGAVAQSTAPDRAPSLLYNAVTATVGTALALQISNPQQLQNLNLQFDVLNMRNETAGRFSLELFAGVGTISASNPLKLMGFSTAPDHPGWITSQVFNLAPLFNGHAATETLTMEFVVNGIGITTGQFRAGIDNLHLGVVPEPEHYALLAGLGLAGWGLWRRRS